MKPELDQYQVRPEQFWSALPLFGGDGYDDMDFAQKKDWRAIGDWGKPGYNLGTWPYVIIFFRDREERFDVIEYVEGDVTMWSCPTQEIREAVTNELAFFHWKHKSEPWVELYASVDELPDDLRGPYRS